MLGRLSCIPRAGYQQDMNVSNSVTVQIPRMSQSSAESYLCLISGAPPDHGSLCSLRPPGMWFFSFIFDILSLRVIKHSSPSAALCLHFFPVFTSLSNTPYFSLPFLSFRAAIVFVGAPFYCDSLVFIFFIVILGCLFSLFIFFSRAEIGQSLSCSDTPGLTAAVIVLGCIVTAMTGIIIFLYVKHKRSEFISFFLKQRHTLYRKAFHTCVERSCINKVLIFKHLFCKWK